MSNGRPIYNQLANNASFDYDFSGQLALSSIFDALSYKTAVTPTRFVNLEMLGTEGQVATWKGIAKSIQESNYSYSDWGWHPETNLIDIIDPVQAPNLPELSDDPVANWRRFRKHLVEVYPDKPALQFLRSFEANQTGGVLATLDKRTGTTTLITEESIDAAVISMFVKTVNIRTYLASPPFSRLKKVMIVLGPHRTTNGLLTGWIVDASITDYLSEGQTGSQFAKRLGNITARNPYAADRILGRGNAADFARIYQSYGYNRNQIRPPADFDQCPESLIRIRNT